MLPPSWCMKLASHPLVFSTKPGIEPPVRMVTPSVMMAVSAERSISAIDRVTPGTTAPVQGSWIAGADWLPGNRYHGLLCAPVPHVVGLGPAMPKFDQNSVHGNAIESPEL